MRITFQHITQFLLAIPLLPYTTAVIKYFYLTQPAFSS